MNIEEAKNRLYDIRMNSQDELDAIAIQLVLEALDTDQFRTKNNSTPRQRHIKEALCKNGFVFVDVWWAKGKGGGFFFTSNDSEPFMLGKTFEEAIKVANLLKVVEDPYI